MISVGFPRAASLIVAAVVMTLTLASAHPAAAGSTDWSGVSDLPADPHDPGNGTRAGRDLEIYWHPENVGIAMVRFHAWDEKLDILSYAGVDDLFVRITYYTRNGTKYEWNVDVPPSSDRSVQLGSDDDLKEGGDIYMKMCIDGTTDCSELYHGIT